MIEEENFRNNTKLFVVNIDNNLIFFFILVILVEIKQVNSDVFNTLMNYSWYKRKNNFLSFV